MIITLSGNHAINVINLAKRYEDLTAVEGISSNVKVGRIFGLQGSNGTIDGGDDFEFYS